MSILMSKHGNQAILDKVSADAEIKKPINEIFQTWGNLHDITLNFIDYMGDVVPSSKGKCLLEVCLINAVNSFKNVTAINYGTEAQMVAYIQGLLLDAPEITKISVGTTSDDPTLWEPFSQSISSFQSVYPGIVRIYNEPYSDIKTNSMRLMLLARIITVKDLYWIDQYNSLPDLLGEAA